MATINLRGIPVSFPFKPYDIQRDYMEKVIECLENQTNGVLESPTGTGKTLSLLCSSLAWLSVQKAKYQANVDGLGDMFTDKDDNKTSNDKLKKRLMWDLPTIVYSSRTHSQLTQAMKELKRTSYSYVRSTIVGSRDQMCIHPDVCKLTDNQNKTIMCQAMVKSRSCYFHNKVEKMSCSKEMSEMNIADIEDLISAGQKHKFCPYYMSRELKNTADIIFMPYNYLIDPKARRSQQLDLRNSIIILDEAHNVERICEDSASFQIRTTDITLCIDEITQVMKHIDQVHEFCSGDADMDFSSEDLMLLKTMLLNLEKVIDDIPITNKTEGSTYEGKYIFEILKKAGIDDVSQTQVVSLLDRLIQFMTTSKENPFQRTGTGLSTLQDLLLIAFQKVSDTFKEQINKCYKVHIIVEETKGKKIQQDTWLTKATTTKSACRVLSYWCFSPNFGMQMLIEQGVRSVILTSGTLAPLKPLISELGINIGVRLENPHVVTKDQICVKILGQGPDGVTLNSGYQNRDNEKYINSMGMTIQNFSRHIPGGLLIFFASYALLSKCQENWQLSGIWSNINTEKMIFVEPRTKDAFTTMMYDFYERIRNPVYKGAIFMAVCRGKVSEGLDFADMNGRAVIVTGLPYPPYKDPRVVLKRKYLDVCRSKDTEYLSGQDWYSLEATRAVNQAIGRVIRHRHDYGAIILLDSRFDNPKIKSQLSLWLRDHIVRATNFGEVVRDLRLFFQKAVTLNPVLKEVNIDDNERFPPVNEGRRIYSLKPNISTVPVNEVKIYDIKKPSTSKAGFSNNSSTSSNTLAQDDENDLIVQKSKRSKLNLVKISYSKDSEEKHGRGDIQQYIEMMKKSLHYESYDKFVKAIEAYSRTSDFNEFKDKLNEVFMPNPHLRYLIQGLFPYIKIAHREHFNAYWEIMR